MGPVTSFSDGLGGEFVLPENGRCRGVKGHPRNGWSWTLRARVQTSSLPLPNTAQERAIRSNEHRFGESKKAALAAEAEAFSKVVCLYHLYLRFGGVV